MGFAPLTTRRIVALDSLTRSLNAWQRSWLQVPAPRSRPIRRRPLVRPAPTAFVAEG
jgi:hypothetical protein